MERRFHDVCWGSHACRFPPGHDGWCVCCDPEGIDGADPIDGYVGAFPYYGGVTQFYGEDAAEMQERFDAAMSSAAAQGGR